MSAPAIGPVFCSVCNTGWRHRAPVRRSYDAAIAARLATDLVTAALDLDDWMATREALFDEVNAYQPEDERGDDYDAESANEYRLATR